VLPRFVGSGVTEFYRLDWYKDFNHKWLCAMYQRNRIIKRVTVSVEFVEILMSRVAASDQCWVFPAPETGQVCCFRSAKHWHRTARREQ
jgi:hypothetical protein